MPSAVILKIEYEAGTQCLRITYRSGSIYEYLDVPELIYKEMMSWQSRGAFLNKRIKKNFKFRKIESSTEASPGDQL